MGVSKSLTTSAVLTRYPEKEAHLKAIAGDLLQRAEGLNCPVVVADRFLTMDDEEDDEPDLNAFACGFRKSRRIVIYADLMEHFTDNAIRGVLAHEIAHIHHRHILKKLSWMALPWAGLMGVLQIGGSSGLTNFGIGMGILILFIRMISRRHELQADRQAAHWVGNDTMIETIQSFGKDGVASKLDELLSTHPAHKFRIAALQE